MGQKKCVIQLPHLHSVGNHISPILHPAAARKSHLLVGKTGIASMHTVHRLWVSTFNFQRLAEVNGPAKADDSKIIMVYPYVAFGCTNSFGCGDLVSFTIFHVIKTYSNSSLNSYFVEATFVQSTRT